MTRCEPTVPLHGLAERVWRDVLCIRRSAGDGGWARIDTMPATAFALQATALVRFLDAIDDRSIDPFTLNGADIIDQAVLMTHDVLHAGRDLLILPGDERPRQYEIVHPCQRVRTRRV